MWKQKDQMALNVGQQSKMEKKMLNHTLMFVYINKGYNINVLTYKGLGIGLFVYK
jgi:hypothetical protein